MPQRGELPAMQRPASRAVPEIGPSPSFPVGQVPFRNASQGPASWGFDGTLRYAWGSLGAFLGDFLNIYGASVDQEGNLYVTEWANYRSQMFRPKPDADSAKLIRPMVGRPTE